VSNVPTGNKNVKDLEVYESGEYSLYYMNTANGCLSQSFYHVGDGTLQAGFVADKESGYAPLPVSFTNTSRSTLDTSKVRAVWSFGNGTKLETNFAGKVPKVTYTQPGTFEVSMYVFKGACADTVVKYINVEIPSGIEIPNVFTPNGDGTNDVFFLHIANISKVTITIYDRWGNLVYDLTSEKGNNIEWDGKNQKGVPVASGVYMYTLKATGKDGAEYEKQGNITLLR
jgi:gliding motility-associated-like protein